MPDTTRYRRRKLVHRTSARLAASGPHVTTLPRVVGALLRGQPELRLVADATAGVAKLELVDDRVALVSTVLAARPAALVIPPFDVARISTAPLVLRVRREVPDVAVLVLSNHPAGAGQPMVRAVQAGAHVVTAPTATELHEILASLLVGSEAAGQ